MFMIDLVICMIECSGGEWLGFVIDDGGCDVLLNGWGEIEMIFGWYGLVIVIFE